MFLPYLRPQCQALLPQREPHGHPALPYRRSATPAGCTSTHTHRRTALALLWTYLLCLLECVFRTTRYPVTLYTTPGSRCTPATTVQIIVNAFLSWIILLHTYCTYISYLYLLLATTGVPSVSYFHNARCTFADGNFNTTISFTSDCSYVTDTEYYDIMDSQSYSASLQCTSAASYQSIIPESSAAYAVNT